MFGCNQGKWEFHEEEENRFGHTSQSLPVSLGCWKTRGGGVRGGSRSALVWLEARWSGQRPNAGRIERQMPTALSDIWSVLKVGPSHLQGAGRGIHRAVSPMLLSVVMGWWGKKPRQDLG